MLHTVAACVTALIALQPDAGSPAAPPLSLAATIPLPGVKGRIDHLSQRGARVYIAARGNGSVEVVDLAESRVVASIKDLPEPQGINASGPNKGPGGEFLMVACGGDGSVRFFDPETLRPERKVKLGDDADNLHGSEGRCVVGVGNGKTAALAWFAERDPHQVRRVSLPEHPEGFALLEVIPSAPHAPGEPPSAPPPPSAVRAFVNLPSRGEIAIVDLVNGTTVATWKLSAAGNFPVAIDQSSHGADDAAEKAVLFVGCRSPRRLLALRASDGKELSSVECGPDVDEICLAGGRVFAICGGDRDAPASVWVFSRTPGEHGALRKEAEIQTAPGARTGAVLRWPDANSRMLCVAIPARDGKDAELRLFRPPDR